MASESPIRPDLRQRVHLRVVRWGVSLPSVVEDVLESDLVLAGPLHLVDGQMPAKEDRLLVLWEDANGPHQLPCEMGSVLPRELPQWQVRPVGNARTEQRRSHVRVHADSPATLIRDRQAYAVTLVDLSEGGMRAVLADADTVVGVGDLVSVILTFEKIEHDMRARVVRVQVEPQQPRVIAASFLDLTLTQSDELRRHVFAEQTRARSRTIQ